MGTIQGGAAYFIAPDHLGAPYKIVNSANAQVWVWDHDPFGNGAPTAAAGFWHRLRFPGQVYDSESKLHSNGQRDYDPRLGRYVESDPIGLEGGINTYAYANNNPVNSVDPTGTVVESWWDAGNVAMGLYSFVDNLINGNYAAAGVDFLGLGVDAAAAALPGVPGGAAWAIRTARAAADTGRGIATVYQYGETHFAISVKSGNETLTTQQIRNGPLDTLIAKASPEGAINSRQFELPNAQNALDFQRNLIGQSYGDYNLNSNSCLTYCGDVLRAGGVSDVPNTSVGMARWLRGF